MIRRRRKDGQDGDGSSKYRKIINYSCDCESTTEEYPVTQMLFLCEKTFHGKCGGRQRAFFLRSHHRNVIYDIHKILGFFIPSPSPLARHISTLVCFWATPILPQPCGCHLRMVPFFRPFFLIIVVRSMPKLLRLCLLNENGGISSHSVHLAPLIFSAVFLLSLGLTLSFSAA